MNAIIVRKGKKRIDGFIQDAILDGKILKGIGSLTVKEELYDIIWTEDIVTPLFDDELHFIGFNKTTDQITPAKLYENKPVSNKEDVDKVAGKKVLEEYDVDSQLQIIGEMIELLSNASGVSSASWRKFQTKIRQESDKAKKFKDDNFPD